MKVGRALFSKNDVVAGTFVFGTGTPSHLKLMVTA